MNCSGCSPIYPIEGQGTMCLRPVSPALLEALQTKGRHAEYSEEMLWFHFSDVQELQDRIEEIMEMEKILSLSLAVQLKSTADILTCDLESEWISLSMQHARIKYADIVSTILERKFSSYMQPIVDASEHIIGFEFCFVRLNMEEHLAPMNCLK